MDGKVNEYSFQDIVISGKAMFLFNLKNCSLSDAGFFNQKCHACKQCL